MKVILDLIRRNKIHFLAGFLLVISVAWTFRNLPNAYFEQDEWHSFGHYIYLLSLPPFEFLGNALSSGVLTHFTPLSLFSKMEMYLLWGVNAKPYFITSIILHIATTVAVYFLIFLLLKKKLPAFLGALFFAVNSSHHQAVTWLGTFEGAEGSTFFGVLSLIFFFLSLEGKKRFFTFSILSLFVALLFKETAFVFFFLMLGLILFPLRSLKKRSQSFFALGVMLGVYVVARFSYLIFGVGSRPSAVGDLNQGFLNSLLYNLATVGEKLFALSLTSQQFIRAPSQYLSTFPLGWVEDMTFLEEFYAIGIGLIVCMIVFAGLKKGLPKKPILVGSFFVLLTGLPLFLLNKKLILIDSRFLYTATIGMSIILASFVSFFLEKKSIFEKGYAILLIVLLIVMQGTALVKVIDNLVQIGKERQAILTRIKEDYPRLPLKSLFYTESDTSFYGLAPTERILPFQSGFGQTLLVLYQSNEKFPRGFFDGEFLWDIKDEGFAEFDNRSFGYFRDFNSLAKLVQDKKLSLESIISFKFDSSQGNVQDITGEVRGRLEGYLVSKRVVDKTVLVVSASNNSEDAWMAIDGDRKSAWDSKLPYNRPQYFEVGLSRAMTIAQITIDTYNNVNQNQVGFVVSLSSDGKTWKDVFYAKRYPPDENGYINIYFKPQLARFIKIEQKGNHAYANWVIHDLKIYEKSN